MRIWMLVDNDELSLPVAIFDSYKDLVEWLGCTRDTVVTACKDRNLLLEVVTI